MNNKAQRETALKRLFVKSGFIVITLSLFSGTAVVAEFDGGLSQSVDNSISQAVNKTVYVLLFNPRTENEGIHTIYFQSRNKVLAFESFEDAQRFAQKLIAQSFPSATVEAVERQEIKDFCKMNDYDYELISPGTEVIPPGDNGEWSFKKRIICNSQRCFPRL